MLIISVFKILALQAHCHCCPWEGVLLLRWRHQPLSTCKHLHPNLPSFMEYITFVICRVCNEVNVFSSEAGTMIGEPDSIVDLGFTEVPEEIFTEYLSSLGESSYRWTLAQATRLWSFARTGSTLSFTFACLQIESENLTFRRKSSFFLFILYWCSLLRPTLDTKIRLTILHDEPNQNQVSVDNCFR